MIDVAYSGVHQAYQLALAADEAGWLRHFHCSIYDAPGKWGGLLGKLAGASALRSRRVEGLDPRRVREHPWPLLSKLVTDRFFQGDRNDWLQANNAFDQKIARQILRSSPKLFIGGETCDQHCLEACVQTGAIRVHDCPQLHPGFLTEVMHEAAERSGMTWEGLAESTGMRERKAREYGLAEHLLIYSDVHRRSFEEAGFRPDQLFQCPLWVDTEFWNASAERKRSASSTLKLLFAGGVNLRKGIPFLLKALALLKSGCSLTLAGPVGDDFVIPDRVQDCLIEVTGPVSKEKLKELYASHDLFVLPSVADSFGFVALEAMACGLPVVLTENCGAPVPSPSWRVPAMDAAALANRISFYLDEPDKLSEDRTTAERFAAEFTPERYRSSIRNFLATILPAS